MRISSGFYFGFNFERTIWWIFHPKKKPVFWILKFTVTSSSVLSFTNWGVCCCCCTGRHWSINQVNLLITAASRTPPAPTSPLQQTTEAAITPELFHLFSFSATRVLNSDPLAPLWGSEHWYFLSTLSCMMKNCREETCSRFNEEARFGFCYMWKCERN